MNSQPNEYAHVVLLHSNDLHSRLEQAAQMASYIQETRQLYGRDRLLVVDCGDHMDRMRLETEGSDGLVNIELMNSAGYEAVTLGNNEGLTYGQEVLEQAYQQASFPVICANLLEVGSGRQPSWLKTHGIIEKNGIRIGLTAVTAAFTPFYRLLGWDAREPLSMLSEQVRALRPLVDVVVVMSHLGLPADEQMAAQVPGIDLILGAHTHHLLLEPIVIGETTLCAAGKFGDYIGRVEIELDRKTRRPSFRAGCVPLTGHALDPQAAAIIDGFREAGERRLSRVITRLDTALPALAERESPLGNLLAAGLRRWTDADLGIVNSGQLLGGLAAGDVTEGQLHALCPSPINPCRMRLSGRQLRQALEEALLPEFVHRAIRGFGFRGLILGTLSVDNLTIRYDDRRRSYDKIVDVRVADEPLLDDRLYLVGTIDMFTFGTGYLSLKDGTETEFFLPEFLRNVLANELQDAQALHQCQQLRWQAIENESS